MFGRARRPRFCRASHTRRLAHRSDTDTPPATFRGSAPGASTNSDQTHAPRRSGSSTFSSVAIHCLTPNLP